MPFARRPEGAKPMMRIITMLAVAGLLVLSAALFPADAARKQGAKGDSETACVNWCFDHNTTTVNRDRCLNQCECYYHGNLCLGAGNGGGTFNASPRPSGNQP
jgi:hypothetical protein